MSYVQLYHTACNVLQVFQALYHKYHLITIIYLQKIFRVVFERSQVLFVERKSKKIDILGFCLLS